MKRKAAMVREGSRMELETFIRDSAAKAQRVAYKLCGDMEEAEELVQEAQYRVARNWKRYDASKPLDNWFYCVLRNAFMDSRRRPSRRCGVSLDALVDGSDGVRYADIISDHGENHLERLEREEVAAMARRALARLSEKHRTVLRLRDMEGSRYEEIARHIGVPIGTVRSRISDARQAFRRRLPEMAAAA